VLTTLYSFMQNDGAYPGASLTPGEDGSFYGTTVRGGASDFGTIFKLDSTGVFRMLHFFQGRGGAFPAASLTSGEAGERGSFYGTTVAGGASGLGTIFKLDSAGVLTILHSFRGSDGANPRAGLTPAEGGGFYGTTFEGGDGGLGTIFRLDST